MDYRIAEARYLFDMTGKVATDAIRPVILESWKRSAQIPREVRNHKLNPDELKQRFQKHEALFSSSIVIGRILHPIFLHKALLCTTDADSYIISQIRIEKFMNQLGITTQEARVGTSAFSLAMQLDEPIKTECQENYALRYQHCSIATAPLHCKNGKVSGAFSLVTYFGRPLPPNVLSIVSIAAKLIEELAASGGAPWKSKLFSTLLEQIASGILILDKRGKILAINSLAQDFFTKQGRLTRGASIAEREFQAITGPLQQKNELFDTNVTLNRMTHICALAERIVLPQEEIIVLTFDERLNSASLGTTPANPQRKTVPIIGESSQWIAIRETIRKVTAVNATKILIEGETGTGKTQVAKAIHELSGRSGKLITINCGALPKELLQSELFGYVGGAFTGAKPNGNKGKIEMANGGTLFLDEIGEMPLDMQVALLTVIEERKVDRLGSSQSIDVDVNIIAATNKNLREEVQKGNFREDLYYRLSVVRIRIPPLRERPLDIPLLSDYFLTSIAARLKIEPKHISHDALELLSKYEFPGNVRELQNLLEYALVFCDSDTITADFISGAIHKDVNQQGQNITSYQKLTSLSNNSRDEQILGILQQNNGNISKTAKALGVSRNTIYKILKGREPDSGAEN